MAVILYLAAIAMACCGIYILDATEVQYVGGLLVGLGLMVSRWSGQADD